MLIFHWVKSDIDRLLQWGTLICSLATGIVVVWAVSALLHTSSHVEEGERAASDKKVAHAAYLYPLEAIGSGSLALRPRIACGWLARLAEELSVLAYNSRPDAMPREAKILIALREGVQQNAVNGKMLYLQERSEGKGLLFVDMPTAIWVKPILLDNGNLLIEAGRKLISKEGVVFGEEKGEFVTSAVTGKKSAFETPIVYFDELKGGSCLGHDALILKYGGKEYASWQGKIKIEFTQGTRNYACFISNGDLLQYREGEWRVILPQDPPDSSLPIARVIAATTNGMEIEAWDESGFHCVQAKVEAKKPQPALNPQDLLPTSLRMRSRAQVSCAFGKRRLIIKKGDWLLKTSHGWRNLRKAQEIEDYLHHRLKGELFIFDDIEKQQGKCLLQGHLFDSMRAHATPIALPVEMEKREKKQK